MQVHFIEKWKGVWRTKFTKSINSREKFEEIWNVKRRRGTRPYIKKPRMTQWKENCSLSKPLRRPLTRHLLKQRWYMKFQIPSQHKYLYKRGHRHLFHKESRRLWKNNNLTSSWKSRNNFVSIYHWLKLFIKCQTTQNSWKLYWKKGKEWKDLQV